MVFTVFALLCQGDWEIYNTPIIYIIISHYRFGVFSCQLNLQPPNAAAYSFSEVKSNNVQSGQEEILSPHNSNSLEVFPFWDSGLVYLDQKDLGPDPSLVAMELIWLPWASYHIQLTYHTDLLWGICFQYSKRICMDSFTFPAVPDQYIRYPKLMVFQKSCHRDHKNYFSCFTLVET